MHITCHETQKKFGDLPPYLTYDFDLCVKLVKHDKGGVLAAPERAELVVLVPRHRQEGVPPVHKVTLHKNAFIIQNHRQSFLGLSAPDPYPSIIKQK